MEFIYTGATIVTAKFASEVQQVQSILQFQVVVQSLVLAPPGQVPRGIPTRIPENSTPRDERKRHMEGITGGKPPKRRYTRRKYAAEVKIKKERVESTEHGADKENAVPEYYENMEGGKRILGLLRELEVKSTRTSRPLTKLILLYLKRDQRSIELNIRR